MAYNFVTKVKYRNAVIVLNFCVIFSKILRIFDLSKKDYNNKVVKENIWNDTCKEVFKKMSNHKVKGNSLKVKVVCIDI